MNTQVVLEQFNPQVRVVHETLKGIGPVSEREFVYLNVFAKLQNGFSFFETSVEHEKEPLKSNPVRGEIYWRILRLEQEGSNTVVNFYGCVHPKGSIFSFLSGKMVEKVKSQAHALQALMQKEGDKEKNNQEEQKQQQQQNTQEQQFPDIPQIYQDRITQMKTQCEQEISSNDWQINENNNDFKFWQKDLYKWKAFKCQLLIANKNIQEVISWFTDDQKQLQWRDTIKSFQILEQYNPQVKAVQELLKGILLVSERELVYLNIQWKKGSEQVIFESSIEHSSKLVQESPVRGEVIWRYLNFVQQGENTQVIYAGCIHPRGTIPAFVSGKYMEKMKSQVLKLKELLSV